MVERNAGLAPERRIEFRVGIHLGDVVEESDGDLMGDGVNIAARLEGIAKPGGICLSEDAYRQVKARLDLAVTDLGAAGLFAGSRQTGAGEADQVRRSKAAFNIRAAGRGDRRARCEGSAWYFLGANRPAPVSSNAPAADASHLSIVILPFANLSGGPCVLPGIVIVGRRSMVERGGAFPIHSRS